MNKRVIGYVDSDFEGAKMLLLHSRMSGRFEFKVADINSVTKKNVMFENDNSKGLSGTRKDKSFFGVYSTYTSYFLVRKDQTVEGAIREVVDGIDTHLAKVIEEIGKERNYIYKAQGGYQP